MRSDLKDLDTVLFEKVKQFLERNEFFSIYLPAEGRTDLDIGAGTLAGIDTVKEDADQLIILGELYALAGHFAISNLQHLVFNKIAAGFSRGWDYRAMLHLVHQIFRDIPGIVDNTAALTTITRIRSKLRTEGRLERVMF
jgi:hypothetical protein